MSKNTIPYRLSEKNIEFLRRMNENAYKAGKIPYGDISLDKLLAAIYRYFDANNEMYLQLLETIGKMEAQKNGS